MSRPHPKPTAPSSGTLNTPVTPTAPVTADTIDALLDQMPDPVTPPSDNPTPDPTPMPPTGEFADVVEHAVLFVLGPKNGTREMLDTRITAVSIEGIHPSNTGVYEIDHDSGTATWCPVVPAPTPVDTDPDAI